MHGLFYFFQISLPRVLGNDDVRAKGNPYKERNEKPDDRRIAADGGHGFLTNKTPHDDDVDGIEKLLADPVTARSMAKETVLSPIDPWSMSIFLIYP